MNNKHLVNIALQHIKDDNPHGIDDIKKGIYNDIDGIHADLNTVKADVLQVNSKSDSIQGFLDSVKSEVDNLPAVIEARGRLAEEVSLSLIDGKLKEEEARRVADILDTLNEAKGYTDMGKIGTDKYIEDTKREIIDHSDSLLYQFEEQLGPLAWEDKVELARLGETIIDGGYLKTELIKAHSIGAAHINTNELVVGDNIVMGENAVISWNHIDDKPFIPTEPEDIGARPDDWNPTWDDVDYKPNDLAFLGDIPDEGYITTITNDTIKTTNVIATNLKVRSANISGQLTVSQLDVTGINRIYDSTNSLQYIEMNNNTLLIRSRYYNIQDIDFKIKYEQSSSTITMGVDNVVDPERYRGISFSDAIDFKKRTNSYGNSYFWGEIGIMGTISGLSGNHISSGTVPYARLPVGTGSSQISQGSHTHNYLSTTGGTVTGTITVPYISASSVLELSSSSHMNIKSGNNTIYFDGNLLPWATNSKNLGSTGYRWNNLYVRSGGVNEGSDIRLKDNITDIPEDLLRFFADEVKPKMFEVDGKLHFGYIAQDVERALYKYALKTIGIDGARDYVDEFNILGRGESYLSLVYSQVAVLKEAEMQKRMEEFELKLNELGGN